MSNELLHGVTRNSSVLRVTTPVSVSASASVLSPNQEVTNVGTCTPLARADWDHLVEERIGIMHESGMTLARAQALAIQDTMRTHGKRPAEAV